jgi:hypothetical protein
VNPEQYHGDNTGGGGSHSLILEKEAKKETEIQDKTNNKP